MKLKNLISFKIILILTIIIVLITSIHTYVKGKETQEYTLMEDIDYSETLDNIKNPERGFYNTAFLRMMPSGTKPTTSGANLVHLRVNIGDFSSAVNGTEDLELTEDALNALDQTLQNIKSRGGSVIIRFAYDGFNGKKDLEPSLDMIYKHISQLKPIFYKNQDVLAYVELGFFGPWGEMHSSKVSNTDNVSRAIDLMLDTVPTNIKIGVRTPNYYAKWLGIDRSKLNENITVKGTDEYRVGLFNDGYLGSNNDLGTFLNRQIEIAWLQNQATHTFYGGEVVANANPATKPAINTVEYMSEEAFITHTTYLNSEWNGNVINAWKEETYNGSDQLYVGQSGYLYIANHLGYRFVLRKSEVTKEVNKNRNLKLNLHIENVGFANLINEKKVTLVLKKGEQTYEIPTEIDATNWNSKEISNVNIEVPLPKDIELGEWNIYLRISQNGDMGTDGNYKCIQLANKNIYDETLGANYVGKFNILEEVKEPDTSGSQDEPDTPDIPDSPDISDDLNTPDSSDGQDKTDTPDEPDIPDLPNTSDYPNKPQDPNELDPIYDNNDDKGKYSGNIDDTTVDMEKLPKTGNNIELILALVSLIISINIVVSIIKMRED